MIIYNQMNAKCSKLHTCETRSNRVLSILTKYKILMILINITSMVMISDLTWRFPNWKGAEAKFGLIRPQLTTEMDSYKLKIIA